MAYKRYRTIDKKKLKALCTLLFDLNGCDALPRNMPFTPSMKIAIVDTEHLGEMPGDFKQLHPALTPEMKQYTLSLWEKLQQRKQRAEEARKIKASNKAKASG